MVMSLTCKRCVYSKATPDMELRCPYAEDLHGTLCSIFERTLLSLPMLADCNDCVRFKYCVTNRDGLSPCKFFDMKGDTKDIVRPLHSSRWQRLNLGKK
jgi:hypothetical protein